MWAIVGSALRRKRGELRGKLQQRKVKREHRRRSHALMVYFPCDRGHCPLKKHPRFKSLPPQCHNNHNQVQPVPK